MKEKSVLEQALLQVETLEEVVKANAKGILASTMKQELSELLKESMEEEDEVNEQPTTPEEEEEKDMSDEAETSEQEDDEEEADDEESDLDNEPEKDIDSLDSEDMDTDDMGDEMGADDMGGDDLGMDDEFGPDEELPTGDFEDESDEDVLDMTGASNDEVLKVFKAMKPEDGIIVKKDGNNVELETGEDDFIIKLDEEEEEEVSEGWDEEEMSEGDDAPFEKDVHESDDEETIYEIDLDDEDMHEEETTEGSMPGLSKPKKVEPKESSHEVEATEAARTKWNPHGDKGGANRTGIKSKKMFKAGSGQINEEVEKLKKQNSEYKKALVLFKEKLNEVAVFNANLAYATRLFTEHSTTKQEKLSILKRFDSVSSMNESKNLFTTIKSELENKKPVTESVVEKISSTPSTSSSEVLSESKAYENPQFRRMKELMGKIK